MTPNAQFLESLDLIPWLQRCGQAGDLQVAFESVQLANWSEIPVVYTDDWEQIKRAQRRELTSSLILNHRRQGNFWNELLSHAQAEVDRRIGESVHNTIFAQGLKQFFADSIRSDTVMATMVATYLAAGCVVPPFFLDLFAVYREGYWPCGWDGADFPSGFLIYY